MSERMNEAARSRLSEIQERLTRITPLPWTREDGSFAYVIAQGEPLAMLDRKEDAEFIAHSPDDIAFLLQRVRTLEEALGEEAALAEEYGNYHPELSDEPSLYWDGYNEAAERCKAASLERAKRLRAALASSSASDAPGDADD